LYSARTFFQSAWRDLKHYQLGMDVPVALGIGGAFVASLWHTSIGHGEIYFDSVVMFSFFLLTGRYLEMIARHRAGQAAEALVKLLPATATRITDTGDEIVAVAELAPGERVRIKPGETVPSDGTVLEGVSSVDESLLTGESLPMSRHAGEELIGGTVNIESPLIMRVDKVGADTVLSAIVRLLDRAQSEKPHLAQLADRVAGWFVAALLLLAVVIALYWWQTDPTRAFSIVLSVLVVTCPCALSLATPVALTAATGALTRMGVLTTRSHALETLARITHVVFDKTGTLTEGRLTQTDVVRLGMLTRDRCVAIAAALEQGSEHPLGRALIAANSVAMPLPVSEQRAIPGEGMEGAVQGVTYRIGTFEFAQAMSGRTCALPETLSEAVGTVVYLADQRGVLAGFVFEDSLRVGAAEAVAELRKLGIEVQLLSGDGERPVQQVASILGISSAEARLKPADKLQRLQALQAQGAIVAMIGDGVNDAPVLAAAQVSLAMGSGTQLAAAASDMVLLSERLAHLAPAVLMARRTLVVIRQNLAWALIYNLVAVPLAASGLITPWMAAIGMSASSLLVVVNALRLREAPSATLASAQTR